MWNLIRSIEMLRLIESIEKLLSISNLNFDTSSLFSSMLIKRFKVVYCSMFFDDRIATSWSINKSLNSRSSYLDSIETLNVYEIETASAKAMILLFEINRCLKVLLTSTLMIAFESSSDLSEVRKHFVFDSLNVWECSLNSITKKLIEMSSNETSIDNFSKYWLI